MTLTKNSYKWGKYSRCKEMITPTAYSFSFSYFLVPVNTIYADIYSYLSNMQSKEIGKILQGFFFQRMISSFNNKHLGVSNFYWLPKIHKSMVIESAINNQNSKMIKIFELNDLILRPIVGGPKCPMRKLSQLIDILLKPLLKRIKSFIRDSLDYLDKCPI